MTATGTATVSGIFQNTSVFLGVVGGHATFNDATVQGPTTPGQFLAFAGPLQGGGNLNGNIKILNSYQPGINDSVTNVNGNLTLGTGASLTLNIGGTQIPGHSYDQVFLNSGSTFNITGANLVFTFNGIDLAGTFSPSSGDSYQLLVNNGGSVVGTFATLPTTNFGLQPGLSWDFSTLYSTGFVMVDGAVIPEPSAVAGIFGVAVLGFTVILRRRSRRQNGPKA